MNSKVFLDSSVLVEWAKKTQIDLFNYLSVNTQYRLCISQIIPSEFTYYWLAIEGKKAPVTLKRDGVISQIVSSYSPADVLSRLTFLESRTALIPLYLHFMEQYNLLPNDALILATCKISGINQIASYDADFEHAYVAEGIQLVRQISDLA